MESSAHSSGTSIDTPASSEPAIADPGAAGELEVILEHRFARPELLERAMTHSSLAHERGADEPQREDNETLEFLGDAVVGMVAAEAVYRRYPGAYQKER